MVHAGRVFVAGIHPSRICAAGSFESLRWNACVHPLDLGLHSYPKEFFGIGVRTHVNSKGKIPSTGKKKFSREEGRTHDSAFRYPSGIGVRLWSDRPEFHSRSHHDYFSWSRHTNDLNNGTALATLPIASGYKVSAGTGRSGVSIL